MQNHDDYHEPAWLEIALAVGLAALGLLGLWAAALKITAGWA